MELFDVVDERGIPTGRTVEREFAHENDICHRTAHVWVVRMKDGRPQVLLQKRSQGKDSFPGCYDTSSAGHVPAGDDPISSAIRELEEELGIKATEDDLSFAGVIRIHFEKTFYTKPFKDNEVAFIFVYDKPVETADFVLQKEEVESVEWFDLEAVREAIAPPRDEQFCVPSEGLETVRKWIEGTYEELIFTWTREPEGYAFGDNRIEITTQPHTDLWQRTYYHFRNDNAPALQAEIEDKYFSFTVKTDFSGSHHRFDQCGVVMYLDSDNWLKGSVEYENEQFQHLGSVVTNHGYSDWATTEIPASVKTMWYRFSRREDDYCIECSADGADFSQMRICHMHEGSGKIRFGMYACSPEDSSFTAVFTDMEVTSCKWKAHDGQQPDEE